MLMYRFSAEAEILRSLTRVFMESTKKKTGLAQVSSVSTARHPRLLLYGTCVKPYIVSRYTVYSNKVCSVIVDQHVSGRVSTRRNTLNGFSEVFPRLVEPAKKRNLRTNDYGSHDILYEEPLSLESASFMDGMPSPTSSSSSWIVCRHV